MVELNGRLNLKYAKGKAKPLKQRKIVSDSFHKLINKTYVLLNLEDI